MTPYQRLVEDWKDCQRCPLCTTRKRVVFTRGTIPCRVLFVGEAPGDSEDVIGQPFVGPAGILLNQIIRRAHVADIPHAFFNLVGCRPTDERGLKSHDPPDDESILACAPRLQRFVRICDGALGSPSSPAMALRNRANGTVGADFLKLIVCVGATARDWLDEKRRDSVKLHRHIQRVDIKHPAAILRLNTAIKGLEVQRCVVTIDNAVEAAMRGPEDPEVL